MSAAQKESTPHLPRQSILNDRHRALGSDLSQSWNDMPIPQFYATDPYAEIGANSLSSWSHRCVDAQNSECIRTAGNGIS